MGKIRINHTVVQALLIYGGFIWLIALLVVLPHFSDLLLLPATENLGVSHASSVDTTYFAWRVPLTFFFFFRWSTRSGQSCFRLLGIMLCSQFGHWWSSFCLSRVNFGVAVFSYFIPWRLVWPSTSFPWWHYGRFIIICISKVTTIWWDGLVRLRCRFRNTGLN